MTLDFKGSYMNFEDVRQFCLSQKGVTESFPFGEDTLVFKVMDKMFCLGGLEPPFSINLKCDPEKVVELREQYEYVLPGYHMNKKHWNTIDLDQHVNQDLVEEWILDSYNLVVAGLTKKAKKELEALES